MMQDEAVAVGIAIGREMPQMKEEWIGEKWIGTHRENR